MLAAADAPVVERPQLGPLRLGVPLAEVVAERQHPLLGPRPLLVAAGAAEGRVEAVLLDGVEQRDRLQPVARGARPALLGHAARVDRVLHRRHDQALAELGDPAVAELDRLGEVVARVHVHHGEREAGGPEGLLGQAQQHDRVLAAREQQHGPLELGGHLAEQVDGLGLERAQVRQLEVPCGCDRGAHDTCRPHSVFSEPAQRPSRPRAGLGARRAPDRGVAAVVQRVVRQVVLGDVGPHVALGPVHQRADLPDLAVGVPAALLGGRAGGRLLAAQAGDPRVEPVQGAVQRLDLAGAAAALCRPGAARGSPRRRPRPSLRSASPARARWRRSPGTARRCRW